MPANKYRVYSDAEEEHLNAFCQENHITRIGDEYYFEIRDQKYRISRYVVKPSKELVFKSGSYSEHKPMIYIKARRADVERIYLTLKNGTDEEIEEILNPKPKPKAKQQNVSKKAVEPSKQENLLDMLLNFKR